MNDERKNRPSASEFERLALCPGSYALCKQAPPPEETEDAASGTKIHAYLAGEILREKLTEEEDHTAERCASKLRELEEQLEIPDDAPRLIEQRYWFGALFSGKADVVRMWTNKAGDRCALIADYKTGRNDTTTAEGNIQLRALLSAFVENELCNRIYTAIIAPWQTTELSVCEYRDTDIDKAILECTKIINECEKENAPLNPSEKACKYCRAKAICPALQSESTSALDVLSANGKPLTRESFALVAQSLSADNLLQLMEGDSLREMANAAIRGEIRRRVLIGDPEVCQHWRITEGQEREKIVDVNKVFSKLQAMGVSANAFAAACTVTKKALTDLVKAEIGGKGKALKETIADITEGAVEITKTQGSLERLDLV